MRPGLGTAVRVEFMARHIPSQAGNATSEAFETLFVQFACINSQDGHVLYHVACWSELLTSIPTYGILITMLLAGHELWTSMQYSLIRASRCRKSCERDLIRIVRREK